MKNRFTLMFALLLLCLGTGAALASTPDGQTPSEETVCDSETGAAYGLCNAYCEAMDCDSDDPQASENACNRVSEKFRQITGEDPPCAVPLPKCGDCLVSHRGFGCEVPACQAAVCAQSDSDCCDTSAFWVEQINCPQDALRLCVPTLCTP